MKKQIPPKELPLMIDEVMKGEKYYITSALALEFQNLIDFGNVDFIEVCVDSKSDIKKLQSLEKYAAVTMKNIGGEILNGPVIVVHIGNTGDYRRLKYAGGFINLAVPERAIVDCLKKGGIWFMDEVEYPALLRAHVDGILNWKRIEKLAGKEGVSDELYALVEFTRKESNIKIYIKTPAVELELPNATLKGAIDEVIRY